MVIYNVFNNVIKSLGMQTLTHPIFYNSKVAIRFNIGDDNGNEVYLDNENDLIVNPEYVSACLERAKSFDMNDRFQEYIDLYNEVFNK